MFHILTLIGKPGLRVLTSALVQDTSRAVNGGTPVWLCEGEACDIPLPTDTNLDAIANTVSDLISDQPVDMVIQPTANRRKRLLVADMDSTMIDQECIDELAERAGIKTQVAQITARAMNGELEFEPALHERVALLKGLELSVVDAVIGSQITLASGGRTLVQTMKQNGAYCALVSGGFTLFTGPVAAALGFDEHRSNRLDHDGGKLTGKVNLPVLGSEAKVEALDEISDRLKLSRSDAICVGDGANDLPMLQAAGTGVALHAKPSVAAAARHRIDHGDLTALLYIQGYSDKEIVRCDDRF